MYLSFFLLHNRTVIIALLIFYNGGGKKCDRCKNPLLTLKSGIDASHCVAKVYSIGLRFAKRMHFALYASWGGAAGGSA